MIFRCIYQNFGNESSGDKHIMKQYGNWFQYYGMRYTSTSHPDFWTLLEGFSGSNHIYPIAFNAMALYLPVKLNFILSATASQIRFCFHLVNGVRNTELISVSQSCSLQHVDFLSYADKNTKAFQIPEFFPLLMTGK